MCLRYYLQTRTVNLVRIRLAGGRKTSWLSAASFRATLDLGMSRFQALRFKHTDRKEIYCALKRPNEDPKATRRLPFLWLPQGYGTVAPHSCLSIDLGRMEKLSNSGLPHGKGVL